MDQKVLTSRIAAAYWDAEVEVRYFNSLQPNVKVDGYFLAKLQHKPNPDSTYKLILKPLSEISAAQIYDCYKQIGAEMFETDFSKESFLHTFSPTEISEPDMRGGQSYYYTLIDHLRGLGFDMGHGSIPSLIDANLATNINSNKE